MPQNLSFVFHCFITFQIVTICCTLSKKIIHFDHSDNHDEILCWTVKLKEADLQSVLTKQKYVSPVNLPLWSKNVGTISHDVFEDHPGHYVLCHMERVEEEKLNFQGIHGNHSHLRKHNLDLFLQLKGEIENSLQEHEGVEWFSQEVVRQRKTRSVSFNDPEYKQQWHLHNRHKHDMDINVTGVWDNNITGSGVTVAVVDDGMEWTHPDLHANYNIMGSWDLNDNDPDPSPSASKDTNHHGTRCAGEIAAVANNFMCGVGVAYHAKVSGIRVLDGPMTDSLEAAAFNKKLQVNDVYSCSWGPDDDGKTVDGPHIMAAKAMKYGVDFGRKGYGSIFVVASGNGGRHQDNCNYDGYANSIYTLTIGAVDEMGRMPFYAEECASMLGVTFSSGRSDERDIVTTDWTLKGGNGCTNKHTGTSAAAPLAAAMVALVLQARACLTWRDVQYLVILTAVKVDVDIAHWQQNGAGLFHSHKHGFGLLKAWRMVNAAKIWETVPWLTSYAVGETDVRFEIPKGSSNPLKITHTVMDKDIEGYGLYILENVQVTVTITHPHRGLLGVKLISPSGTVSVIGAPRPLDNSSYGFKDWTFSTVRCWGERPTGTWTLEVLDNDNNIYPIGHLLKWQIILFGTPLPFEEFQDRRRKIEAAMSGEYLTGNYSLPCSQPPTGAKPDVPMSQKTLKILVLACAFCAVMALYETMEYAMCYNDEKKEHMAKMKLAARAQRLTNQGSSSINPEDAGESTGLLQSEEIPMETFTFQEQRNVSQNSDHATVSDFHQRDNQDDSEDVLFDIASHNQSNNNHISGASNISQTNVSFHDDNLLDNLIHSNQSSNNIHGYPPSNHSSTLTACTDAEPSLSVDSVSLTNGGLGNHGNSGTCDNDSFSYHGNTPSCWNGTSSVLPLHDDNPINGETIDIVESDLLLR